MRFTKEYFEEYFSYNQNTGRLIWKVDRPRASAGDEAGTIDHEGYVIVNLNRVQHRAHRIIWVLSTGMNPDQIDHQNGNRSDNRLENLRSVSNKENSRNQRLKENNTSGQSGVSWHKRFDKWISHIRVDGRRVHLGLFADIKDAIEARKSAEVLYGFHPNHGVERVKYQHL